MRYIKLYESFGIDQHIESHSDHFFRCINREPNRNSFDFIYRNGLGEFNLNIIIDKNIKQLGYFKPEPNFSIYLKSREDKGTLLHELKHLDYQTKNKNINNSMYRKANKILGQYPDAPDTLLMLFYLYEDNEFQSKYHGYYSDFNEFIKDKVDAETTTITDLRNLFLKFLSNPNTDPSWAWYLNSNKIKFTDFVSKRKLDICFYKMLDNNIKDKISKHKWTNSLIINSIKFAWYEFRKKIYWTPEERVEIDKLIKYFEKDIENKRLKYNRKFLRIIPLMAKKYNISY